MKLTSVVETSWAPGSSQKKLRFDAIYDQKIAEDGSFQKATPCAFAELVIDNPEALAQFTPGKTYYFDVHEVPSA